MQVLLCAVLPSTPHSIRDTRDAAFARPGEDAAAGLLARAVADGLMRSHRLGDMVVEATLVDIDVGLARRAAADARRDGAAGESETE